MSYADRLQKLVEYQTNIRSALEAKGATISSDATLKDFPSAVDTITGDYTGPTPADFVENGMGAYASMMSNATKIASYAFYCDPNITEVNFPNVTSISPKAFAGCSNLSMISFPKCEFLGEYVFNQCSKLKEVYLPELTSGDAQGYFFNQCSLLTNVELPKLNFPYISCAFSGCLHLETVSLPVFSGILSYCTFGGCYELREVYAPFVTGVANTCFSSCSALATLSFPTLQTIGSSAFVNAFALTKLYILSDTMVKLSASNAFNYSPISKSTYTGSFGSVFVKYNLLDGYKSSTNWVTYADRLAAVVPFSATNLSESDSITAFVDGKESPIPLEVPSTEFTYSVYSKYPKYIGTQADVDENGEINISLPTDGVTLTVNTTPEDAIVKITEDGIADTYTKTKILNSGDTVDYMAYKEIDETKTYYYTEEHNTITINNDETLNVSLRTRCYDKVTAENVTTGSSDLKTSILTLFDVDGDALRSKLDCKKTKNESGYFVYTTPATASKARFTVYYKDSDSYSSYGNIVLRISTVLDENSYTDYKTLKPSTVLQDGNVLCARITQNKRKYEVELEPSTTYYFQELYTSYSTYMGWGNYMYIEDLVLYEDSGKAVPIFATNADKVYGLVNNKFSEDVLLTGDVEEFTYTAYADGKPKITGTQTDIDSSGVLNVTFPETGALLSITTVPESAECELIQDGVYSYLSKETLVNPGDAVTVSIKPQEINGTRYGKYSQTVTIENDTVVNIELKEGKIPENITADNAAQYTTFVDGENFEVSEGVIKSGSKSYHVSNGLSIGYVALMPELDCRMTINYSISSDQSNDFGVVMLTETPKTFIRNNLLSVPSNCTRLVYTSGRIDNASSESATLLAGETYYVYFAYTKNAGGDSYGDRFYIHSITFEEV